MIKKKEIHLKGESCKGTLVLSTNGTTEIKKDLIRSTLDTNNGINNVK